MQRTIYALLSVLLGTSILCVICMLNLYATAHVIQPKVFMIPAIFGGILGFFLFQWHERYRLNRGKRIHLNGVLRAIRSINKILANERDSGVLIQKICDTLVENRSYHSVWIALTDRDGQWGTFAQSALGDDFRLITDIFKNGEPVACCQRVMTQPDVVITDAPLTLCGACPLVSGYQARGAISAKLACNGEIYGMITLSVPEAMLFDPEENRLANELSEDIAFGLHAIKLDEKRKDSEKRFRTLVESSLTGISIVQGNEVVYQNKEQERLLGPLPRSNIMGEYENIHPEDLSGVKQFSKEIIKGDISLLDIDFRYLPEKNGGEQVWIHCRASKVVYHKQSSILFNMIDMTRPKKLEKLLIVQDKMASLGRVAAGIAHEIRNPLSGINIYLNTLEKFFDRDEEREKVKQVFHHLQSASRKIESVIRRVMDFSKPSQPNFILTNVNGPIEEALTLTATTLRKSDVLLEIELTRDLPTCRLDPQQFEEVILNMINNAADSLRGVVGQKRIKVTSGVHKQHVAVRILDSGPGILAENRKKVFDPFFTTKADSTGIGLSICQRIISDHHGEINVQTNQWGGTEFRISIPIAKQAG